MEFTKIAELYQAWQTEWRFLIAPNADLEHHNAERETAILGTRELVDQLAVATIGRSLRSGRDTFGVVSLPPAASEERVSISAASLGVTFELAADSVEITLRTRLAHPRHLPRMFDDYFRDLLTLTSAGDFRYLSVKPDRNVRNTVCAILADAASGAEQGALTVSWTFNYPIEQLLSSAGYAFRVLYDAQHDLFVQEAKAFESSGDWRRRLSEHGEYEH